MCSIFYDGTIDFEVRYHQKQMSKYFENKELFFLQVKYPFIKCFNMVTFNYEKYWTGVVVVGLTWYQHVDDCLNKEKCDISQIWWE